VRNTDNPTSYSNYDPDGQLPSDVDDCGDYSTCDGCSESFPVEDLYQHEDGNFYCEACNYETEQDRADGRADDLYHSMREDGEL